MKRRCSTFFPQASVAFAAAMLVVASVALDGQASAPLSPELSGRWQLNAELSENAEEKLASAGQAFGGAVGRGGRTGGGRPGGFGGFGGRGGGRPGTGDMQVQMGEVRGLLLNAPTWFMLTQDDQKVVLTERDGRVRRLPTNNDAVKVDGRDVRTKWDDNRLVSETTVRNTKIVETFERSPDASSRLIVITRLDVQGQGISVRRVYDAVTE